MKDVSGLDRLIAKVPALEVVPKPNPGLWLNSRAFSLGALCVFSIIPLSLNIYYNNLKCMSNYPSRQKYEADFDLASGKVTFRRVR